MAQILFMRAFFVFVAQMHWVITVSYHTQIIATMFNLTQKAQFSEKSETNTERMNRSYSRASFDEENYNYCISTIYSF